MSFRREFVRFLLVGGIGFVVDGALLTALIHGAGLPPLPARLISFSVALTVTWLLNRHLTFRHRADSRRFAEWRRYVAVNGAGGALNLGIYAALVTLVPIFVSYPLGAFAIASGVALIFNFMGSRALVFRGDSVSRR